MAFSNKGIKKKSDLKNILLAGSWCLVDFPNFDEKSDGINILSHPWKDPVLLLTSYNKKKI